MEGIELSSPESQSGVLTVKLQSPCVEDEGVEPSSLNLAILELYMLIGLPVKTTSTSLFWENKQNVQTLITFLFQCKLPTRWDYATALREKDALMETVL